MTKNKYDEALEDLRQATQGEMTAQDFVRYQGPVVRAALLSASEREWRAMDQMPKAVKKGFMRVYSFKPFVHESRSYCNLARAYKFESHMGNRELDLFMDIPAPPKEER